MRSLYSRARRLRLPGDAGCLLRVLEQCRSEMKSLDGDFELRRAKGDDEPYDYMGRICGEEFGMSIVFAHVLKCALAVVLTLRLRPILMKRIG